MNRPIDGIDLDGKEWESCKTYDANTGITTIHYDLQLKVVNGTMDDEKVQGIVKRAEARMESALNKGSDGKTVYTVTYTYATIQPAEVEQAKATGIVLEFVDYRKINEKEYKSGSKTLSAGVNKSNTQNGLIQISPFELTKKNGKVNFSTYSTRELAAMVNHELGHGGRLSHPMSETIPDIGQYEMLKGGSYKKDEAGRLIRSAVPDETIKNNIMNTGANNTIPPDNLGDLKNLTPGQVKSFEKVQEYEQKTSTKYKG